MSVRNIILILVAVAITAGTGLVARSWISNQRQEPVAAAPPPVKKTYVLVAVKDLPTGTFIKENLLTWQSWPDDNMDETYVLEGAQPVESFTGRPVAVTIVRAWPIASARLT